MTNHALLFGVCQSSLADAVDNSALKNSLRPVKKTDNLVFIGHFLSCVHG